MKHPSMMMFTHMTHSHDYISVVIGWELGWIELIISNLVTHLPQFLAIPFLPLTSLMVIMMHYKSGIRTWCYIMLGQDKQMTDLSLLVVGSQGWPIRRDSMITLFQAGLRSTSLNIFFNGEIAPSAWAPCESSRAMASAHGGRAGFRNLYPGAIL